MSIDAETLRLLILQSMPGAQSVNVEDMRGDGIYYTVTVVSHAFKDLSRLDQHRLVYAAIGDKVDDIEALQLITRPEEGATE